MEWVTMATQWYPKPTEGFYVKGGIGLGGLQENGFEPTLGYWKLRTANLGLTAGFGYDVHLTNAFSLSPFADILFTAPSEGQLNGGSTGVRVGTNLIHIGLATSWR
jgi:hypothetical protein